MLKLMKYEWRKCLFSKIVLLILTAIAEIVYLIGVFSKNEDWYSIGIIGLVLCAVFGIIFNGVESLLTFSKDLNTKQSYMLFLTPHTSYEILGAKVLMNAGSLVIAGVFYLALAAIDIFVGISYIGGMQELLDIFQMITRVQIQWDEVLKVGSLMFAATLAGWLHTIVVGDLAIVLSATTLAGKKASGFVSFLIFLLISGICSALLSLIPESLELMLHMWIVIGCTLLMTIIFYTVTGWIMDKKLSV